MYQIMLVEDEALVRESMAQNTNWEKFGFAPPHVFENGRQAADHLETVLPDVVITDICMPFLDGLELAKLVYERFPETIVVVLTGFSEFSYAQKAIRYHVHDYLLKPVSPKEFDQLLENLSAELSRRENRQGLYSRAVMADEVLKDHFFQSLLQTDAPQELPASMREAGAGLGGRLHAVALALPPARPEGIEARGQRVAEVCAPAQFRLLGDQHVMLIVSGDETAELMARTAAGARQLRMQLQEADVHTAIGIGGAYAGVDGLRTSAQEAQHALGYAFSTGETLLFDPELRKASGSLQTDFAAAADPDGLASDARAAAARARHAPAAAGIRAGGGPAVRRAAGGLYPAVPGAAERHPGRPLRPDGSGVYRRALCRLRSQAAGPAGASGRQPQLFFHGLQGEDRPVVRGIPDESAHGKGQGIPARDGPLHL